jgi:hypothetical protein
MSNPIQHLANGNLEKFRETVHSVLYTKLGEVLGQTRRNIAEAVYGPDKGEKVPPGVGSAKKGKSKKAAKGSC